MFSPAPSVFARKAPVTLMNTNTVLKTDLPFPRFRSGKVRDVYDLGDHLMLVTTDRISAFDCIMPNGIPGKGRILTQTSLFWFERLASAKPHHVAGTWETCSAEYPSVSPEQSQSLLGRTIIGVKTTPLPIECVVRGYISGSLWKEYSAALKADPGSRSVHLHGYDLPPDLRESDRLAEPIFTPATKAESGHDINISYAEAAEFVGEEIASSVRERSVALYAEASAYARERGIIIADTKFEFGLLNGELFLIDEILTPDSSRFWDASQYEPGRGQASFDKQFLRDYLETLDWDKTPPAPELPDDIVRKTAERYEEAFRRITS